jgi:hypothetical protein
MVKRKRLKQARKCGFERALLGNLLRMFTVHTPCCWNGRGAISKQIYSNAQDQDWRFFIAASYSQALPNVRLDARDAFVSSFNGKKSHAARGGFVDLGWLDGWSDVLRERNICPVSN